MPFTKSPTDIDFFFSDAGFARDVAAPPKLTVTVLPLPLDDGGIAPSTTHEIAPVDIGGTAVTDSLFGAQRSRAPVEGAEVGRVLHVDDVLDRRGFDGGAGGQDRGPVVGWDHFGGPVEASLQRVPDLSQRGHPHPAGLRGTGTRQPVTFALLLHVVGNAL